MAFALDGQGRGTVVAEGRTTHEEGTVALRACLFDSAAASASRPTVLRAGVAGIEDLTISANRDGHGLVTWGETGGPALLANRFDGRRMTFRAVETICCTGEPENQNVTIHVGTPAGEVVVVWEHVGENRHELWMTRSGPR